MQVYHILSNQNTYCYYNQFKNGIEIEFADNTLLFLSCVEAEKNLHTPPELLKSH
jgi:hypothetical protein